MVVDLDALAELNQLFFYVLCSSHGSDLDEVLHAPLGGVVGLLPLLVDIEQSDVIATRLHEVLVSVVSVYDLLFRPVKYRIAD